MQQNTQYTEYSNKNSSHPSISTIKRFNRKAQPHNSQGFSKKGGETRLTPREGVSLVESYYMWELFYLF